MSRLALVDLACTRGGRMLFEGLSLTLAAGDAALVTGPNGVGKSSLLRICAGLLTPAAGTVVRDGAVALMAEAAGLDGERALRDALGWWARIDGRSDAIDMAMADVGIADLADVPVRLLSTGQRRRAQIARTLANDAPIWLLDEPANGLDTASVALLERLIGRHRSGGGIVLVATHLPLALHGALEVAL
ncbi:cytochrome C biogenesis protein CcmA [Sphingomonas sp. Leaf33]|uniref:heme ABC exporter ATP-binding protein CcmA n=1 Tax=Sphingomonas sp. Leaf33 TaxID=1736215 RepID=UPI0006F2BBFA|nr:heme ABC exporter ATP-binding protein CcmA [Sphingomonas sp. Leaf33]KQN24968.1 cytochrome C biogenesis protein CcmA [Sphingomonas sp. Leaf33]